MLMWEFNLVFFCEGDFTIQQPEDYPSILNIPTMCLMSRQSHMKMRTMLNMAARVSSCHGRKFFLNVTGFISYHNSIIKEDSKIMTELVDWRYINYITQICVDGLYLCVCVTHNDIVFSMHWVLPVVYFSLLASKHIRFMFGESMYTTLLMCIIF